MKIYLYGAGRNGKKIYNILSSVKKPGEVAGFIETNPKWQGIKFCELPVHSVENILKVLDEETLIILTPDLYVSIGIAQNLKTLKIRQYIYWDYMEEYGVEKILKELAGESSCAIENRSLAFENKLLSCQVEFLMKHIEPSSLKPASDKERQKQLNLVNLAADVQNIMSGTEIKLFLIAGNLLGYVRHNKGFIPWDDDLDLGITEEDFVKLKEFCCDRFPYYEYEGIYDNTLIYAWYEAMTAKHTDEIIVLTTPLLFRIYRNQEFIDVLPIRGYMDKISFEEHSLFLDTYRKEMSNCATCDVQRDMLKKVLLEDADYEDSKGVNWTYSPLTWEAYYSNSGIDQWFNRNDIFPLQRIVFENVEFWAPNNIDAWLKVEFGNNYMQLPKNLGLHIH